MTQHELELVPVGPASVEDLVDELLTTVDLEDADQVDAFVRRVGVEAIRRQRRELVDGLDEGTLCPTCGQTAKRYKRLLSSSIAAALIAMHRISIYTWQGGGPTAPGAKICGSWIHVDRELIQELDTHFARDFSILRFWNFIEPMPKDDESSRTKTSGYWRITKAGRRFVLGKTRAPRHVFIFANRREGFSSDSTSIQEALGDAFDYELLMGGRGGPDRVPKAIAEAAS